MEQRVQPTMFDLLHGIAVITGGMVGAQWGFKWFGYTGATVVGVFGATLGFLLGWAFHRLLDVLMVLSVRRKSTQTLRAKLADEFTPGTFVSSLIISVLLERGEPVESFRDYIFRQLHSEYVTWRKAGLYNLSICYPDLAPKLAGFDIFQPTEGDLQRVKDIERMIDHV